MSTNTTEVPTWLLSVRSHQLDDFVQWVDETGGLEQPGFDAVQQSFVYIPDQQIDQNLDPYSTKYFDQMIKLYEELSGRKLDQETGEMTNFDLPAHVGHANPYNLSSAKTISRHVHAIASSIKHAELPDNARVADLGCGWGLTSELLHFCGCKVTAVDINPDFVSLVRQRAERRQANIETLCSNFDDLELPKDFDAIFFYECLHHAVKPWDTLAKVTEFLKPEGKVFFSGEPINQLWWKNWGLRLDAGAIYCIRKHGWFESGWSEVFLCEMFDRLGWSLTLYKGAGLDGGAVGVAQRSELKSHTPDIEKMMRERDHARRYPWKYMRSALMERLKKRAGR